MREDYMQISAPVFNIQTYSIHDGPGIRVTVFVKGCPLRCLWCANPESNLAAPQLMTYSSKCVGCGRCIDKCPKGAISIGEKNGRIIELTDRGRCTACGKCVEVCLAGAREIAGKMTTVQEVLNKVLKDKMFMDASGGGITVSGGECLLYPEFTEALLYAAHGAGIHTAVESCGFASKEAIERVFTQADLALLDIKHMNSEAHRRLTGAANETILDNIKHIYHKMKVPVIVRVPVIPGCNDSDENIAATAEFTLTELGPDVAVHLLPYHRLGESKNESLGKTMDLSIEIPGDEHMQSLKSIVEGYGLRSHIGG